MAFHQIIRDRRILAALATAVLFASAAEPALAASDHQLQFTFGGPGRNPSVATMKHYILGCLPDGTRTFGGDPGESAGPWDVEVPAVRGHEYTNAEIRVLLLGQHCAPVRPAKVVGVVVTDG
jgi:hypothetical protein